MVAISVSIVLSFYPAYAGWVKEIVDDEYDSGCYTSLLLDESDSPHISHVLTTPPLDELKYVRWSGNGWVTDIVDDAPGGIGYTKIAFDSEENPHIAYLKEKTEEPYVTSIMYAYKDGSNWYVSEIAESSHPGFHNNFLDIHCHFQ